VRKERQRYAYNQVSIVNYEKKEKKVIDAWEKRNFLFFFSCCNDQILRVQKYEISKYC
jgi:hypothetical protein